MQHQAPENFKVKRSLAQQLMAVLSDRIRTGQLSHGDRLPTESQLMAEQGLSRTVVREAISGLNAAGLVETRHGIGTFILGPSIGALQIDVFAIKTTRGVLDVLELRIALEVESAGLAAHRRSSQRCVAHWTSSTINLRMVKPRRRRIFDFICALPKPAAIGISQILSRVWAVALSRAHASTHPL